MTKILVPPEVLLAVSDQFDRASDQLETNKNTLNQQIQMLVSCWDGTTCSRFYYDFQQAYRDMKLTIEHMQVTSQELKRIAYRFMQVDNEADHTDPRCLAPQLVFPDGMSEVHSGKGMEEKSFGDQLKDLGDEAKAFAEGAKSGATALWSSVKDTANSLIEDPIGTGKQMAYDATVGTAEEIVNTTVWGAKMAFDVGDTREKFDERIQTEQERMNEMGMSTYLGQQGALILGGVALNRVGVKKTPNLRHDAGGDGGRGENIGVRVSSDTIINSATQAKKGGETVAGHALQKHAGRNPDIWGKVKGGSDQINQTAQKHLEDIIDAPGDFVTVTNDRGITFLEKKLPDGRGVRLNQDGTFKGFIDQ